MLGCVLFLNCGLYLICSFGPEYSVWCDHIGWPAAFVGVENPAPKFSKDFIVPELEISSDVTIWPLVVDIVIACLTVGGIVVVTQVTRVRYPEIFRVSILQYLAMTAFVALLLCLESQEVREFERDENGLPRLVGIAYRVCKLAVYAALAINFFVLSKPSWWRRRGANGNVTR